jgi:hypothetical protein
MAQEKVFFYFLIAVLTMGVSVCFHRISDMHIYKTKILVFGTSEVSNGKKVRSEKEGSVIIRIWAIKC